MSLVTTASNVDYLITPLQLQYGDYEGTAYSEAVYRTALVSGVKYLSRKWNGKYYIDSSNNVQRNTDITFDTETPTIEYQDEYAIVLAAAVILRGLKLTSSADAFTSWQTPDLSVSSGSKERVFVKLYEAAVKDLEDYFSKKLGTSRKRFMYTHDRVYPIPPITTGEA